MIDLRVEEVLKGFNFLNIFLFFIFIIIIIIVILILLNSFSTRKTEKLDPGGSNNSTIFNQ